MGGQPWVDSQLRYHTGPNAYLVAERGEDGSVLRWGAFLHEYSPPFDSWDDEMRSTFSASAAALWSGAGWNNVNEATGPQTGGRKPPACGLL